MRNMNTLPLIIGIAFILLGTYIIVRRRYVARVLREFYLQYPIVRYSGRSQLSSRPIYIIALGITFLVIGLIGITLFLA